MVLLHLLHELSSERGWRLTVAHLNHQLRGRASDADERLVRRTASRLGLRFVAERADVRGGARAWKVSPEMAARKLRHDFLARTALRLRIATVALAHHADDQVELFFLRLLRGSGAEALAGIKPRTRSPSDPRIFLVRPLLGLSKASLRAYADAEGVRFREDASNARFEIQRNRIRHELLPLLRRHYQPALDRAVLRVMDIIGAESELVAAAARQWQRQEQGGSGAAFKGLPLAVQRRVVQAQLRELGLEADYALVERLRLKEGKPISIGAEEGEARCVARDGGRVQWYERVPGQFNPSACEVVLGEGAGEVEFDGVRVRWRLLPWQAGLRPKAAPRQEWFDADRVGDLVRLRHWQKGDKFRPIGGAGALKLQDFFTNAKVARRRRHELLLAASASGEVFWVEEMRIAERFKLTERTKRCLHWVWQRL